MPKVVRLLIYEGSVEWLKAQLDHSIADGNPYGYACGSDYSMRVITLASDIDHDRFGSDRPAKSIEDYP